MPEVLPRDILFRAGADTLLRYGVPCLRSQIPSRGGEEGKEVFARADATTVATYFDKGNVLRFAAAGKLRLDYGLSGTVAAILLEAARTNVPLWSRDLTNAAWVKTNVAAAKDQTGIDGVVSSASKITASAANGTCLQAVTLTPSSQRLQSAYVKRVTGSGTVQMTTNNGTNWDAVTVTSAWTRVSVGPYTLDNPTLGFRLVTSGDAIAVDFVQNETDAFASSPIATTTVAVTRAADLFYLPIGFPPQALTVYFKFREAGNTGLTNATLWRITNAAANAQSFNVVGNFGTGYMVRHTTNAAAPVFSTLTTAPVFGDTVELNAVMNADGSVQIAQSLNGGAIETATASAAAAIEEGWSGNRLYLNSRGEAAGEPLGATRLVDCIVAAGIFTLSEMQAIP